MRQFRANRDVRPNDGFMRYIVELDNREVSLKAHSQYLELKAIKIQKSKKHVSKIGPLQIEEKAGGVHFDGLIDSGRGEGMHTGMPHSCAIDPILVVSCDPFGDTLTFH